MKYIAPLDDFSFIINEVLGLDEILDLPNFSSFNSDLFSAVLQEAAKFAQTCLSPINQIGDKEGSNLENAKVKTPSGFKQAYHEFVQNSWNSVPFSPEIGGQGLPWLISTAISEMWSGANMAFGLCPLLTQGSIELLSHHGSSEQKATYLGKLVSGHWTGTMCLTEPQAGSDVGAITTKATKNGDHYLIKGQKIFITYGDHDLTDNIIHMVLARLPDAQAGTKGISLFIVPKILHNSQNNDVKTVSLEHKLGIHASPTAILSFGDNNGAIGYLVGEENAGLKYMFTMMNNARLAVGIEGIAVGENSYQMALAYAKERIQSREIGVKNDKPVTIINHPDIKRTLLNIRSNIFSMRLLALYIAKHIDIAKHHSDNSVKSKSQAIVDLLIPVVKAHSTNLGFLMSSEALQIFGGMGYIEETGIAQNLRDSRIAMIYEGTNGIQALDLVMRKLTLENGAYFNYFIDSITNELTKKSAGKAPNYYEKTKNGLQILSEATNQLQQLNNKNPQKSAFHATPYLQLFGTVAGAAMLCLSALAAEAKSDSPTYKEKIELADYYANFILPSVYYIKDLVKISVS